MDISDSIQGSVLVVSPQGRLDSTSAPEFERQLRAKLAAGHHRVVIDLDALAYVSSAGLRVLLVIAKALKAEGGRMGLCRLKTPIMEVFRISGFDRIFTIVPSLEEAIERIGATP
jgi:anti-anti-sigma factor